jgi:predicted dienelactone hydrolase
MPDWAFLAPCTQGQTKSNLRVCVDADGFDRTAFHREFNAAVLKFFNEYLSDGKNRSRYATTLSLLNDRF